MIKPSFRSESFCDVFYFLLLFDCNIFRQILRNIDNDRFLNNFHVCMNDTQIVVLRISQSHNDHLAGQLDNGICWLHGIFHHFDMEWHLKTIYISKRVSSKWYRRKKLRPIRAFYTCKFIGKIFISPTTHIVPRGLKGCHHCF